MTKQYIWALAITGAFVAGTILASTLYDNTAFAIHQPNHNPTGDDEDMGWKEAVDDLQDQIDNNNTVSQTYQKKVDASIDPNTADAIFVECDPGDVATGGGFFNIGAEITSSIGINSDGDGATGTDVVVGWRIGAVNHDDGLQALVTSLVICDDITP